MRKGSEKEISFVVMENLFWSPVQIDESYDLKGSTVGRTVEKDESSPDQSLKDNNLNQKLKIGAKMKSKLLEQIERDTKFLVSKGICDYSFLVGIHKVRGTFPPKLEYQ